MNDYARVRELFDITVPGPDADEQTLIEYLEQVMLDGRESPRGFAPAEISGIHYLDEWGKELGFNFANVDQDAQTSLPWDMYQVLRGRFDQQAVDEALRTDPIYADLLQEASHRGVDYCAWGEDYAQDLPVTATRRLGTAHRLALQGDYLYSAMTTDSLEGMIEASLGKRPSLADLEHYQLLAQVLDRLDTYTALFTHDTQGLAMCEERWRLFLDESQQEALEDSPRLLPYRAFATGEGADADGTYMAIVLAHADEETAQQNIQRLEQRIVAGTSLLYGEPWREIFQAWNVSSDGCLVLAKLRTDRWDLWRLFVEVGDPLLLH